MLERLSLFEEPEIFKLSTSNTGSPTCSSFFENTFVSSPTINRAIFRSSASLLEISPTFRPWRRTAIRFEKAKTSRNL